MPTAGGRAYYRGIAKDRGARQNLFHALLGVFHRIEWRWVRYGTPEPEGAEYIAVCLPAFSPDTVHRDDD